MTQTTVGIIRGTSQTIMAIRDRFYFLRARGPWATLCCLPGMVVSFGV